MKPVNFFALVVFGFAGHPVSAQQTYQNEPLILAGKPIADIARGSEWQVGRWTISPQIPHDSLSFPVYSGSEAFGFRTDKDSILFRIRAGETKSFYVKLGDQAPAHTVITGIAYSWDKLVYGNAPGRTDLKIRYEQTRNGYFDTLRQLYPLKAYTSKDHTDTEKILSILNWTHLQWKHDGSNSPKGTDAISILAEVRDGGRFPCFAYAIVLRDQLIANGYKARVLYLKTKDAETRQGSPGHVVTEVYVNDLKKWAFVDGQFNVMPMLEGKPLNAVEFQQALSSRFDEVVMASRQEVSKNGYTDFVYDYLYYFDTALDQRRLPANEKITVDNKRSVMLVPEGAKGLTKINFWNSTVDYCVYTWSLNDFYAVPD